MRKLIIALGFLALATPAFAETLQEVTTRGIDIVIGDMTFKVDYTPDGKFSAAEGQVTGTGRIDGEKLCTTSNIQPEESCVAYPLGKKSGDSFELTSPQGTVTIKIH
jgi:hypothetical protein